MSLSIFVDMHRNRIIIFAISGLSRTRWGYRLSAFADGAATYALIRRRSDHDSEITKPPLLEELVYVGSGWARPRVGSLLKAVRRSFDREGLEAPRPGERHGVDDWAAGIGTSLDISELFLIVVFNGIPDDVERELLRIYREEFGQLPPANRHDRIGRLTVKGRTKCPTCVLSGIVAMFIRRRKP
ncbi:hypothetical protein [Caulobacter sp. DWP3-1-3b2]|uniref:hypothetical protein n=1 Tax=Caulobacter sp. DWP3-1-3b2 TaxID=2804643 RepID=UPI003CEE4BE4